MIRVWFLAGVVLVLVTGVLVWGQRGRSRSREVRGGGVMVLDPVCLTYIPQARAYRRRVGGVDYAFCSPECADAFPRFSPADQATQPAAPKGRA